MNLKKSIKVSVFTAATVCFIFLLTPLPSASALSLSPIIEDLLQVNPPQNTTQPQPTTQPAPRAATPAASVPPASPAQNQPVPAGTPGAAKPSGETANPASTQNVSSPANTTPNTEIGNTNKNSKISLAADEKPTNNNKNFYEAKTIPSNYDNYAKIGTYAAVISGLLLTVYFGTKLLPGIILNKILKMN